MHPLGLIALAELAKSESRDRDAGRRPAGQALPDAPPPSRWAGVKSRIAALVGQSVSARRSAMSAPPGIPPAAAERAPDPA